MPNTKPQHLAACSVALNSPDGNSAAQIFPAGRFSVPHGAMMGSGDWQMDAAAAVALIAKVSALKNDILVDYEHQTLLTDENGKPNPAAGWLRREASAWEWRDGVGLFHTDPKWTPAAAKSIAEDEYRYLSAVFSYDAVTGYPLEIYHVALTNTPAIDGMAPVVAALSARLGAARITPTPTPETPTVEDLLEQSICFLRLPIASTAADVIREFQKISGQLQSAAPPGAARSPLADQLAALSAAKPDPALFVPLAQFESLKTDFAALKTAHDERLVNDLVDPALSDGRLLPAQEQWARDLGKSNLAALKGYLETAKPIAALTNTQTGNKPPVGGEDVSSEAPLEDICKAEWKKSAALRAEFADDVDSYIAYTRASKNGQVRLFSKREDS